MTNPTEPGGVQFNAPLSGLRVRMLREREIRATELHAVCILAMVPVLEPFFQTLCL